MQLRSSYSEEELERGVLPIHNVLNIGISVVENTIHYWWENFGSVDL